MSEQDIEITDNREPGSYASALYYKLRDEPVRIVINENGHQFGGEKIGRFGNYLYVCITH